MTPIKPSLSITRVTIQIETTVEVYASGSITGIATVVSHNDTKVTFVGRLEKSDGVWCVFEGNLMVSAVDTKTEAIEDVRRRVTQRAASWAA